jgi:hypothetical protein
MNINMNKNEYSELKIDKIESILYYCKNEAKESDELRSLMLNKYEKLHYNNLDYSILDVINFLNSITKKHFKKRSLISYLPVFDELYYTSVNIDSLDIIKNIDSINILIKSAEAKIFKTKLILIKTAEAIEKSIFFLTKVIDKKSNLELFNKKNKKKLSVIYSSSIVLKKKTLNRIIENIEKDINKIEKKKSLIELQIIRYENLIKSQIPIWIKLYLTLGDNCSNKEIKFFLQKNKISL